MQGKAFTGLNQAVRREARIDVFRELQILKNTNDNLEDEVTDLEDQVNKTSGQGDALAAVAKDIEKYQLVSGQKDISGTGISLAVNGGVRAIWLTDIVNELFSAGAEAVSINGIRLTDATAGFDTIPNGQILLNSVILKAPYLVEAIGDKKTLGDALNQPQGIIQRMKESLPEVTADLQSKETVKMEKVI